MSLFLLAGVAADRPCSDGLGPSLASFLDAHRNVAGRPFGPRPARACRLEPAPPRANPQGFSFSVFLPLFTGGPPYIPYVIGIKKPWESLIFFFSCQTLLEQGLNLVMDC